MVEFCKRWTTNTLLYAAFIILLTGCSDAGYDDRTWYQEEVLTQIGELKAEIRGLKEEIASLSKVRSAENQPANHMPEAIDISGAPQLNENAEIALIEFSDFQCPYCARHDRQVFPELKKKYIDTGKLRYVVRDFPLAFHAQAKPAAIAAHCAGDQGQYWPMRHFLFSGGLGRERYLAGAKALNLDLDTFKSCLQEAKYSSRVDDDFIQGQKLGVNGTPRFFVGRVEGEKVVDLVPISGAQPINIFESVIDQFL